jgi:PAS domain S-box-containing protein
MADPSHSVPGLERWSLVLAGLAGLAVLLVGWGAHSILRAQIRRAAEQQLTIMAELKSDQVASWLDTQRSFARAVTHGTLLALEIEKAGRGGPVPGESRARWLQRLETIRSTNGYAEVSVYRLDGSPLLSTRDGPLKPVHAPSLVADAIQALGPVVNTIHREEGGPGASLSLDILAPLVAVDASGKRATATMALQLDPSLVLYPMIQKWPASGGTAEVVLAERRGDQVVILNELHNRPAPALQVRVPLTSRETLVVQAAEGARGLIEGIDYRGVPVLGAAEQIPGTSWLLVAKQDQAELFARLWPRTLATVALALAFVLAASMAVGNGLRSRASRLVAQAIRQNEQFLKAITDALPGMVAYWNHDLRCTFANRRYLDWFGKTSDQMLSITMKEMMGEEMFRRNEPFVLRALAGEAQRFERSLPQPDGSLGHTWVHYVPDVSGDEVRGFFVLLSDITELKKAQLELERLNEALRERTRQAESASHAKSDFLANVSHEIRTPLNAIMGLSHLLQGAEVTPKQRDYLARIQGASRSLLAIINDILDLSKIEANKVEVEHVALELAGVFRHVEGLVSERAREKGLVLRCGPPPKVEGQLIGDALRLGQVLLNLVSNAVKFTERGWVSLSARVVEEEAERVRIRFTVRDTGIGIPADALGRIFEPFRQADGSTTRRYGGTGLGLSISRRLVELMGGELTAQSSPGEGSTFGFVIALERRAAGTLGALAGKRVLVVDDDALFRAVAAEILSGLGMVLRTVRSGAEALQALLDTVAHPSQAYDVVLLDWRMAEMDGMETARRIRGEARLAAQPVLILTTALGREYVDREGEDQLFDGLLLKPVAPAMLRDVVEEAFRKRQGAGPEPLAPAVRRATSGHRRGKVLLAEDNETSRLVIRELLADAGIELEEAANGREAVEKALAPNARFDLVLMDVQMPEMDGFEATVQIRKVLPDLPVVAITAHAMENERQRCLAAGMQDHIAKPFEPQDVWRVVDRWLPGAGPGRKAAAQDARRAPDERFLAALGRDLETLAGHLRRSLAAGDQALAAEAAHALKGLALPAAFATVRESARALEAAIRTGAPWLALAESLEQALGPLAELARAATVPGGGPHRVSARSPPEELRGLLEQIAAKIRRRSLGAKDHVDELHDRIGPDLLLRRLEDCLDRVNFAEAEAALRELAEAMGLPLG